MDRRFAVSLRRYFPSQYVIPIALLLGSSFGCLLALLLHTTMLQDRMERTREIELVHNGLGGAARMVMRDLQDYAKWDDAVRHLATRFDPDWADDNISAYLGVIQGYDHVLALDPRGRAIYAFADRHRRTPPADVVRLLGPGFVAALGQVRAAAGASRKPIASGYSRAGDAVYIVSVALVVPLTDKVKPPPGRPLMLVLTKRVDRPFLAELAAAHHAPRLRLATVKPADATAIPLVGLDGGRVGWVAWVSHQPGTELRQHVLPGFALIALIALLAAAWILRRARKGMEALRGSEARALHHALHDPLTGLGNRRAMIERLSGKSGPLTLMYMDLDGFKETNDVYGHGAGDELLIEAARRIACAAPGADLIARSGGDEFAIVLMAPLPLAAARLADTILAAFHAPFAVAGYNVSAGISIGIAQNAGGCAAAELIRRADVAMYAAKANGKDCCYAYDPTMDAEYDERRRLERDLRLAIAGGQIGVMFQPIVDAAGGQVIGVEALARWTHPRHGPISPDIFIRVAERSGLINDLGRSVLTAACREAIRWDIDLAVNLSPAQFWDRTLVARVAEALAETGFPACRLELEITESYFLRRPDAAEEILRELRALGIRIALDDFGTGFASIGYLQRLSFDRIKIDRSFVTHVAESGRAADMARAIVALAEALDLAVTAEGIETEAQAQIMRMIGCTRLQGWLFGRPMAPAAMAAWLAEARVVRA